MDTFRSIQDHQQNVNSIFKLDMIIHILLPAMKITYYRILINCSCIHNLSTILDQNLTDVIKDMNMPTREK